MVSPQLKVAVDIGSQRDWVAVGDVGGELFEEFDVEHTAGLSEFVGVRRVSAAGGIDKCWHTDADWTA